MRLTARCLRFQVPQACPAIPQDRPLTRADLDALIAALEAELPGFALAYKDESRLQRLIAALVWPFNRRYLSDYTTVMLGRVWLPSRAHFEAAHPEGLYRLLCHEAVHLHDARHWPILFELSYLLLLPAGLSLRALWEWRAYQESIRVEVWREGQLSAHSARRIAEAFTGPEYLFMWPFPRSVRAAIARAEARAQRQRPAPTPAPAG